ncbi:Acetyl-CoA synthetase (NDP-forming) beta subunit [Syntrophobacter sp. SbD1]|nr:Acetyl-CoA synthetase (NDP-forming) beta subunit [Syntrophobacter sp. SbD1]
MDRLLLGVDAIAFLDKEGIRVLESSLARDENEAASMASRIGFPVALKISSPDVIHKTETGGIRVLLKSEQEVRQAFREVTTVFRSDSPEKKLEGVMVQKLGRGFELIVGARKDRQFGHVLMFGLGGIYAEAAKDVSFRLIPVTKRDAREMIEELQCYGMLKNPRSGTVDLPGIEDFLLQVSALIEKHEEIQEMDLNPVFASSSDIEVCDARIRIG